MKPIHLLFISVPVALITIASIMLTNQNKPQPVPTAAAPASPTAPQAKEAPAAATLLPPASAPAALEGEPAPATADASAALTEDFWKDQLSELLNNDTLPDRDLGKKLLTVASNPKAPEWARVDAMTNALVFTDDENYAQDIKPYAIRFDLPESLNDVILDDLINRDPAAILPVAREFAAMSGHPLSGAIDDFVKSIEEAASTAN